MRGSKKGHAGEEAIALAPARHVVFEADAPLDGSPGSGGSTPSGRAEPHSVARDPMPGASAQTAARAGHKSDKGKGKSRAGLTASQLYTQMVSRHQLAQISLDELHKSEAQAELAAKNAGLTDSSAKPTKRHDGASYQALGHDETDSEEGQDETSIFDEDPLTSRVHIHQNRSKLQRVPSSGWRTGALRALDEWASEFRAKLRQSRQTRAVFAVVTFLLGAAIVGLAIFPSHSWSSVIGKEKGQTSTVSTSSDAIGTAGAGEGHGLLDLRPGDVGTWYKSLPGAMATGALPFWASGASLPTGTVSYTRGNQVIQTAVPASTPVEDLKPFEHMGPLSPYCSSPGFGVDNIRYRDLSALMLDETGKGTCSVDQVHILHRHGSRFPTIASPARTVRTLAQARDQGDATFAGPLAFLQTWSYQLGEELLTPPGRLQLYHSGVQAHMQYAHLVGQQYKGTPGPVPDLEKRGRDSTVEERSWGGTNKLSSSGALLIRAGSQRRIVDSALSWLQGFYGPQLWNHFVYPPDSDLEAPAGVARALRARSVDGENARIELQVHPEAPGWNTTLASNFACPAVDRGNATTARNLEAFRDAYLQKAVERLQPHVHIRPSAVHPGRAEPTRRWDGKLTPKLLNGMQQLCSFETVALGQSPFCGLFTSQEWLDYEHLWDMQFHGYDGAGTPLGVAQGIGWVNEFLARLTNQPWDPATQTSENATINSDPLRFPTQSTQKVFADFTHDSVLTSVLAALGTRELNALPPTAGEPAQKTTPGIQARFRSSHLVPFGARMIFERLSCGTDPDRSSPYVRMILNDAVVPLSDVGCSDRPDGICSLREFVHALQDRNVRADFQHVCGTPET